MSLLRRGRDNNVADGHSAPYVHHPSEHHAGFGDTGFSVDRSLRLLLLQNRRSLLYQFLLPESFIRACRSQLGLPITLLSTSRLPKPRSSLPEMTSPMAFGRDGAAVRKLRNMAGPSKSQIVKTSPDPDRADSIDDDAFLPSRPPPAPPLPVSATSHTKPPPGDLEPDIASHSEDLPRSETTSRRHSILSEDDTHDWYDLKNSNNDTGPARHNEQERAFSFRRGASKRFAEAWGISDKQFEDAAACREREEVARMWQRHQLELTSSQLLPMSQSLPVNNTPTYVQPEGRQNMQRGDIVDGKWHPILRAQGPSVTQNTHRQADLRRAKTQGGIPTSMPGFHDSFISQFENNSRIEPQTRSSQSQGLHL